MRRSQGGRLALPLIALAVSVLSMSVLAETHLSRDAAIAMVKKGVAAIRTDRHKALIDISDKTNPTWHQDELYLSVYGLDGVVRAHGANTKMVGKNLSALKDIDGKPFIKERLELARTRGAFWQEYKFTNPETRRIEPKRMYCERVADLVVCGGIYQ
jgi:signal transduction histidine kinase